ncbi:MAG TPA: TPM domain-containing protein [Casimicrobiaceae bacterium]
MIASAAARSPLRGAFALALALVAVAAWSSAWAQPSGWETGSDGLAPIPKLTARVTDETNTLSAAERQALETKLADWEQRTSNQLVVLLIPSTKPEPIEAYSIRVAEAWKIGRKGQDNGALFVVAKDDRKMRIEVGYGLEGVLTDVTSRRIIAEDVAPLFRQNRFAAGINAGVDRIIAVVGSGEPLAAPRATPERRGSGFDFETLLILLFVGVPIVGGILSRVFGRLAGSTVGAGVVGAGAWLVAGSIAIAIGAGLIAFFIMLLFGAGGGIGRRGGTWIPTGGWGGGSGGGGGFSGGGGGGFSGGGGSFGGGGASGGW